MHPDISKTGPGERRTRHLAHQPEPPERSAVARLQSYPLDCRRSAVCTSGLHDRLRGRIPWWRIEDTLRTVVDVISTFTTHASWYELRLALMSAYCHVTGTNFTSIQGDDRTVGCRLFKCHPCGFLRPRSPEPAVSISESPPDEICIPPLYYNHSGAGWHNSQST